MINHGQVVRVQSEFRFYYIRFVYKTPNPFPSILIPKQKKKNIEYDLEPFEIPYMRIPMIFFTV